MRTTLTLDEDVFERLSEQSRKTGKPLKTVVNEVLRVGLSHQRPAKAAAFVWRDIKLSTGTPFESTSEMLEGLDGPESR